MEKDGYIKTEYKIGNTTVFVYSPILDEAEKAKREKAAVRALAQFGREIHRKELNDGRQPTHA